MKDRIINCDMDKDKIRAEISEMLSKSIQDIISVLEDELDCQKVEIESFIMKKIKESGFKGIEESAFCLVA